MSKYLSIITYINDLIENHKLKGGDKLPSVRKLSEILNCSPQTVVRAYKKLENDHIIYAVKKSGYYLVSKLESKENIIKEIDFSTVTPHIDSLAYEKFNHCLNHVLNIYKMDFSKYGDPQGLDSLIKTIRKYLQNYQIFTKESEIFITSGTQQAVDLLVKMDFNEGKKTILIENPTYHRIIKSLKVKGIAIKTIERKNNTIDLNRLEEIFKRENIKFFNIIPRYHNPLGGSLDLKTKKEIVRLANIYNVYIVEDDYLVDLDECMRNYSLYNLDINNRVIYLKTFSKILLPGLRISTTIMPPDLCKKFLEYKTHADVHTSTLTQGALDLYIRNGMLNKSIEQMKSTYGKRRRKMKEVCHKFQSPNYKINIPKGGLFLSIEVNKKINLKELIDHMKKSNIKLRNSSECFYNYEGKMNLLTLSISRVNEDEIEMGLNKIFHYLNKF
jgi:DNA-binding transcriptional MocR family regulator